MRLQTKLPAVLVSRYDRLGDLILSLPVLGLLRDAGIASRVLHCSPYAADIGEWALFNELCTELCIGPAPKLELAEGAAGLALFHCRETVALFRSLGLKKTLGPRPRLSALWSYAKSVAQHRSRVEKSEMEYNLDLGRALLRWQGIDVPEFRGLPALALPPTFQSPRESPHTVIAVSNRGSAGNWPIENYLGLGRDRLAQGKKVDFLVSGQDADERRAALERSGITSEGAGIVGDFARLRELIAYLAGASEVVSSSTGSLHLAHAAGVPVLGIYPRERVQSFRRWRPHGYWHTSAVRFLEISSEFDAPL